MGKWSVNLGFDGNTWWTSAILGGFSGAMFDFQKVIHSTRTRKNREFYALNLVFGFDTPKIARTRNKGEIWDPMLPKTGGHCPWRIFVWHIYLPAFGSRKFFHGEDCWDVEFGIPDNKCQQQDEQYYNIYIYILYLFIYIYYIYYKLYIIYYILYII